MLGMLGAIVRVMLDRAIVLRQPWAQAAVEGAFPALIRRVPTNNGGLTAILWRGGMRRRIAFDTFTNNSRGGL